MTSIPLHHALPDAGAKASTGIDRLRLRLAVLGVAALVLITRRFELIAEPAAWNEDAYVFFPQAAELGWASLVTPHTGYYHTLIRVLALAASVLPAAWVPAAYVYGSLAVWLMVMAYVMWADLRAPLWARCAMVLSLVLVPHGGEVWMNLKNIQWVTAVALVVPLIEPEPRSRGRLMLNMAVTLLAGLTGPFVLLFMPAIVLRAVRSPRSVYRWAMAGLGAACSAVHLSAALRSHRVEPRPWNPELVEWAKTIYAHVSGMFNFAPDEVMWVAPTAVLAAALVAAVTVGWLASGREARWDVVGMLACGGAVFAVTLYSFRDTLFLRPLGLAEANGGPRYAYVPYVMVMWSLVWLAAHGGRKGRLAGMVWGVIVATTLLGGHYVSVTPFDRPELPPRDMRPALPGSDAPHAA